MLDVRMHLLMNILLVLLMPFLTSCNKETREGKVNLQINDVVMAGNIDELKKIYNDSEHRSYRDIQGYTLLMLAADAGSTECIQYILDAGHSPNERLDDGMSALWIGVSAGYGEVVDILINHGADLNAKGDREAMTPLMVAVSNSDIEMIIKLIGRGADRRLQDKSGNEAKSYTSDLEILKLLQ